MAHSKDDKKETKWTWQKVLKYVAMVVGALLVLGGVGYLLYTNYLSKESPKTVSFGSPESITLTARKTE